MQCFILSGIRSSSTPPFHHAKDASDGEKEGRKEGGGIFPCIFHWGDCLFVGGCLKNDRYHGYHDYHLAAESCCHYIYSHGNLDRPNEEISLFDSGLSFRFPNYVIQGVVVDFLCSSSARGLSSSSSHPCHSFLDTYNQHLPFLFVTLFPFLIV